jgi:tetratricopeptide (TPR) repeat protein
MTDSTSPGDPVEAACALYEQATAAHAAGDADTAGALFGQALRLFEAAEGPASLNAAATLNCLGAIAEDQSAYAQAAAYYQRAVTIVDHNTTYDPQDDETARAMPEEVVRLRLDAWRNLGRLRRIAGHFDDAEQLFHKALRLAEAFFGPDSDETAWVCNDLGMVGKFAGHFTAAAQWYARALTILTAHHGPDDSALAALYHNLGGLEHARGAFATGEPLARRAVEIRTRTLGPDHPDVAADMAALAALLDGQGKYDEAEALYHQALAIFRRTYGEEHYEIAVNLHNLAAIRQAQERFAEAEDLYRQVLAIKAKLFDADNVEIALTLHNLAVLYTAMAREDEAAALLQRALAIFTRTLRDAHPHVLACRETPGRVAVPASKIAPLFHISSYMRALRDSCQPISPTICSSPAGMRS